MYNEPQDPECVQIRAEIFSALRYAELAAGDAYKAVRVLDGILLDSEKGCEDLYHWNLWNLMLVVQKRPKYRKRATYCS